MFNILLAEDDKQTAGYVKEALELEGMDVDVAYDGKMGLDQYKKKNYDLILLDLEMPKMSGKEFLKEVRKDNPYIDIVVYTNYAKFADIPNLVNMGINGYVNKGPEADLDELIDLIKEKLEPLDENEMERLILQTEKMKKE